MTNLWNRSGETGNRTRTSCSSSQELDRYATAAPWEERENREGKIVKFSHAHMKKRDWGGRKKERPSRPSTPLLWNDFQDWYSTTSYYHWEFSASIFPQIKPRDKISWIRLHPIKLRDKLLNQRKMRDPVIRHTSAWSGLIRKQREEMILWSPYPLVTRATDKRRETGYFSVLSVYFICT